MSGHYLPQYCLEVTLGDNSTIQFVDRAESPELVLQRARVVFASTPGAQFGRPVRFCKHPIDKLIKASGRTVSPLRAEREYQCSICGDYISVKAAC